MRLAMSTKPMVQVSLQADNRHLVTWLAADKRLKPGNTVTLKDYEDPKLVWKILHVGEPTEASSINRGWNNNI